MVTKGNILETISSIEAKIKQLQQLQRDLLFVASEELREIVNLEIVYMQDKVYRYKLQARAWKLID